MTYLLVFYLACAILTGIIGFSYSRWWIRKDPAKRARFATRHTVVTVFGALMGPIGLLITCGAWLLELVEEDDRRIGAHFLETGPAPDGTTSNTSLT